MTIGANFRVGIDSGTMKRVFAIAATLLLSGCVSYYYPQYDADEGVYYAADDGHGSVRVSYRESAYYPYWSVDHFYFGGYWGSYSSSVSIGYHWGYPYRPWYVYDPYPWPYYGGWAYRPYYWYGPHYHYAWYDPYWYWRHHRYRYYGHHGGHYGGHYGGGHHGGGHHGGGHHGGGHGGHDYGQPPDRGVAFDDRQRDRELMTGGRGNGRPPTSTTTRQVGAGGAASSVRYREERKQGPSRLEPVGSVADPAGRPAVQVPRPSAEPVRQRRVTGDGREVRYAGERKVRESRMEPLRSEPAPSRPVRVAPVTRPTRAERPVSRSPERPVVRHGGGMSSRNAGAGRPEPSRAGPVSRGAPAMDSRAARPSPAPARSAPPPSAAPAPARSSRPSMERSHSVSPRSSGSVPRGNARGRTRPD